MKNLTALEKILLSVLGFLLGSWLLWLTQTVMNIADTEEDLNKFREWNISQEKSIKALDKRIDEYHSEPHTH